MSVIHAGLMTTSSLAATTLRSAAEIPDQTGRTAIITGANSGIGRAAAAALAAKRAHVVLAVRKLDKGRGAAARIGGSTEVRELDLADLSSVRAFASGWDRPVDLLINNAGIMVPPASRTADVPGGSFAGPSRMGGQRGPATLVGRSRAAFDEDVARRLWEVSEELTGVSFQLSGPKDRNALR